MMDRLSPHGGIRDRGSDAGSARAACQPAIRRRALARVAILVIAINQLVTTAFAFVAYRNHPGVALGLTTLFAFALCAILSVWIRSDAKYAYEAACESGYVSHLVEEGRGVRIAPECPRRWLAVLHVELQGRAVASERERGWWF